MKTKYIKIDPENIDMALADEAGKVIRDGGLVAFPTETVYGLGANAFDDEAVEKIFKAKGRPNDNPLIVHIADVKEVSNIVAEIPKKAQIVMENFWPGPISIIVKKSEKIGDSVSAGLKTVAVRMPSNSVARAVIRAAGVPVAAPSANTSGKPSPTSPAHVSEDMTGKIDMIVDGGRCEVGLESTVLDLSGKEPVILRPGKISAAMLEPYIGKVKGGSEEQIRDDIVPKCPGMKYKHYAPKASVYVLEYKKNFDLKRLQKLISEQKKEGKRTGVLSCVNEGNIYTSDVYIYGGDTSEEYAENLFYSLRSFDENGADVIFCPICFSDDFAFALRNRLYKSAAGNVLDFEKNEG